MVIRTLKRWFSKSAPDLDEEPVLNITSKVDIGHTFPDIPQKPKVKTPTKNVNRLINPFSTDRADRFEIKVPACTTEYLKRSYEPESLQLSEDGKDPIPVVNSLTVVSIEEFEKYVGENPGHLEFAEQVSTPGLRWQNGLPASHEHNYDFTPVRARGRAGRDLGEFHKNYIGSTTFRRGWSSIVQALTTGKWSVSEPDLKGLPENEREEFKAEAAERSRKIEAALTENLYGGWNQFLHDSLYCLIAGFSIFEEVYADDGTIEKLAFIFPSSLHRWILDEHERELIAVEFERPDRTLYTIDAENLLIMSWDKFGNLFEGIAVMRSTVRWIEALQMFSHLEMAAAEKYGVPYTYVSRQEQSSTSPHADATSRITELLKLAQAAEDPIFALPDNVKIETSSPAGAMPNFDVPKRFCLERILEPLKAEGSLIGIGQTGAFAARQDASEERISSFPYFAKFIAECLNGADNVPYSGTIKKMEDAIYGGPILPGKYCAIQYSIGELDDPGYINRIVAATTAGIITPDEGVENKVRENLDLPDVKVNSSTIPILKEVTDAV